MSRTGIYRGKVTAVIAVYAAAATAMALIGIGPSIAGAHGQSDGHGHGHGDRPGPGHGHGNGKGNCTHFVATYGDDSNSGTEIDEAFETVQQGLDAAVEPGDTVCVRSGVYDAGVTFPNSGSEDGFITLRSYRNEKPVLSGLNVPGNGRLVDINDRSYVRIKGFEIKDWTSTARTNAGGILVKGSGTHIEILDNEVHNLRSENGNTRPIAVWGTSETEPMTNVKISGNEIYHTWQIDSEALQVSGNVDGFEISDNVVRDTDGALYQVGGGLLPPGWGCSTVQARNGVVKDNLGYQKVWDRETDLVGIYLDGVKNVLVDSNVIHDTGYGIFVTFEEYCTSQVGAVINEDITIQNNLVYGNRTAGVWIGSPYSRSGALIVDGAKVLNNTVYQNGTDWEFNFGIGNANDVQVHNNLFVDADRHSLRFLAPPYTNIELDHNLYYSSVSHHPESSEVGGARAIFEYDGVTYTGFDAYRQATGQDANSIYAYPEFELSVDGNFRLVEGSPGVDAGSSLPGLFAEKDLDGKDRPIGDAPDMGAYER